ncbi:uncharacterized protein LOC134230403 isoform X2 [Saccostrea cucullata]|uniref:uncharacterized protein LOC134230403 isoform X2 n=1 Tax=Saccostrea cuccullata TaxID=36930 RepID=UPI002ED60AF8
MQSDGLNRDFCIDGRWYSTGGYLPTDVFTGGHEADGKTLHVVCAHIDGVFTPGKYGKHLSGACVPYGGKEKVCGWFYYLTNSYNHKWMYSWEGASNGNVPHNAVRVGEGLYVGRVHHEGSLIPCKVQTTHGCAYFGYDGKEHKAKKYEVLVSTLKSGLAEEGEGQKEAKE